MKKQNTGFEEKKEKRLKPGKVAHIFTVSTWEPEAALISVSPKRARATVKDLVCRVGVGVNG